MSRVVCLRIGPAGPPVRSLKPSLRRAALLPLAVSALVLAACARDRAGISPPLQQTSPVSHTPARESLQFVVQEPKNGAVVQSPVTVRVNADDLSPRLLAAQIQSRTSGGSGLEWRGNSTLTRAADGAYVGQITYQLAADTEGSVEVSIVDPASGTVVESTTVPVLLKAAP